MKQALARAAYNQVFVAQAPVVLIFWAHPERAEEKYGKRGAELYSLQDATIACAYAELAAAALGLGAVWIGVIDITAVLQIAGIASPWRPVSLLPIGYRGQVPLPTSRRHLADLVHEVPSA
jgi:nitroreductase